MISEDEKQEIINLAVEKTLLMIPEVVGNMMQNHAFLNKMNSKFYTDHPELKDKKDVVASVLEMVEGKHPLEKYDELLKLALPEIKRRIQLTSTLDMTSVQKDPNRDLSDFDIPDTPGQHGQL